MDQETNMQSRASVMTATTTQRAPIDPRVAEVMQVMATARRRWSRDDYGEETQDEAVAAAVIALLRPDSAVKDV